MRDYALHSFGLLLPKMDHNLFQISERQLLTFIRTTRDEMTLKAVMSSMRELVNAATPELSPLAFSLKPLIYDNENDYFDQIVSM